MPGSARSLIVELFGPPAAGKTTLAFAVGAALEARGIRARVVSSARPAERRAPAGSPPCSTVSAPLARTSKLFGAVGSLTPGVAPACVADLMGLMRPGGWARRIRLRRYAIDLHRSWEAAREGDGVAIFDQGFLNLLCSLALQTGSVDPRALARGVTLVPESDIAVRLDAPRALLDARLRERLDRQGILERLFENDVGTSLLQGEISAVLDTLLRRSGRHSLLVSSVDAVGLAEAAELIAEECCSRMEEIA